MLLCIYKMNLLSLNISSPSLVQKTRSALIAPVTAHVSVMSSPRATLPPDKSTPARINKYYPNLKVMMLYLTPSGNAASSICEVKQPAIPNM